MPITATTNKSQAPTSTSDYQLTTAGDKDGGAPAPPNVVASFLVYSAWAPPSWLTWYESEEPVLGRGIGNYHMKDLSHVLIAGAVFASSKNALDKFKSYEWRHYLYLTGTALIILGFCVPNHGWLETYFDGALFRNVGDWAIGVALGLLFWLVAWVIHGWAVWGLEGGLSRAVEDLNFPFFQLAGYKLAYRVEATGPAYTLQHRIYVLKSGDHTKDHLTVLDVLPDSTRPLFMGPKTVYLHTSSFWGNEGSKIDQTSPTKADKDYLHRHGQPAMLNSIHPLLWGALHQAFWVDEIEQLKSQRRVRITDALLVVFLAVLWLLPSLAADQANVNVNKIYAGSTMMQAWLLALAIIAALMVFFWAFWQVLINRTAATLGHARWTRATKLFGPVLEKYYWRLEYHHPPQSHDESTTTTSQLNINDGDAQPMEGLQNAISGMGQYSLAFVPYVPHAPYAPSPTFSR